MGDVLNKERENNSIIFPEPPQDKKSRIKEVSQKLADGTFAFEVPIGANAENIDFKNGYNLEEHFKNVTRSIKVPEEDLGNIPVFELDADFLNGKDANFYLNHLSKGMIEDGDFNDLYRVSDVGTYGFIGEGFKEIVSVEVVDENFAKQTKIRFFDDSDEKICSIRFRSGGQAGDWSEAMEIKGINFLSKGSSLNLDTELDNLFYREDTGFYHGTYNGDTVFVAIEVPSQGIAKQSLYYVNDNIVKARWRNDSTWTEFITIGGNNIKGYYDNTHQINIDNLKTKNDVGVYIAQGNGFLGTMPDEKKDTDVKFILEVSLGEGDRFPYVIHTLTLLGAQARTFIRVSPGTDSWWKWDLVLTKKGLSEVDLNAKTLSGKTLDNILKYKSRGSFTQTSSFDINALHGADKDGMYVCMRQALVSLDPEGHDDGLINQMFDSNDGLIFVELHTADTTYGYAVQTLMSTIGANGGYKMYKRIYMGGTWTKIERIPFFSDIELPAEVKRMVYGKNLTSGSIDDLSHLRDAGAYWINKNTGVTGTFPENTTKYWSLVNFILTPSTDENAILGASQIIQSFTNKKVYMRMNANRVWASWIELTNPTISFSKNTYSGNIDNLYQTSQQGVYLISSSATGTFPSKIIRTGKAVFFIVEVSTNLYAKQTISNDGTGTQFVRYKNGSSWSKWEKVGGDIIVGENYFLNSDLYVVQHPSYNKTMSKVSITTSNSQIADMWFMRREGTAASYYYYEPTTHKWGINCSNNSKIVIEQFLDEGVLMGCGGTLTATLGFSTKYTTTPVDINTIEFNFKTKSTQIYRGTPTYKKMIDKNNNKLFYYIFTFNLPANFDYNQVSLGTFVITNGGLGNIEFMKLEAGSEFTGYKPPDHGSEFLKCSRYYFCIRPGYDKADNYYDITNPLPYGTLFVGSGNSAKQGRLVLKMQFPQGYRRKFFEAISCSKVMIMDSRVEDYPVSSLCSLHEFGYSDMERDGVIFGWSLDYRLPTALPTGTTMLPDVYCQFEDQVNGHLALNCNLRFL